MWWSFYQEPHNLARHLLLVEVVADVVIAVAQRHVGVDHEVLEVLDGLDDGVQLASHFPSSRCISSSSCSRRSMSRVTVWCWRRSGPSWFWMSLLRVSLASLFIEFLPIVVEFLREDVDVLVVGVVVPRSGKAAYLKGVAVLHELVDDLAVVEDHERRWCVDVDVVLFGCVGEDTHPAVVLVQEEFLPFDVQDDRLHWHFPSSWLRMVSNMNCLEGLPPGVALYFLWMARWASAESRTIMHGNWR